MSRGSRDSSLEVWMAVADTVEHVRVPPSAGSLQYLMCSKQIRFISEIVTHLCILSCCNVSLMPRPPLGGDGLAQFRGLLQAKLRTVSYVPG